MTTLMSWFFSVALVQPQQSVLDQCLETLPTSIKVPGDLGQRTVATSRISLLRPKSLSSSLETVDSHPNRRSRLPGKGAMNCPCTVGGVKLKAANSTLNSTHVVLRRQLGGTLTTGCPEKPCGSPCGRWCAGTRSSLPKADGKEHLKATYEGPRYFRLAAQVVMGECKCDGL